MVMMVMLLLLLRIALALDLQRQYTSILRAKFNAPFLSLADLLVACSRRLVVKLDVARGLRLFSNKQQQPILYKD